MRRAIGITSLATAALMSAAVAAGCRLNFTNSAPSGLWFVEPIHNLSIKRGTLVSVCPPDRPVVKAMVESGYIPEGDCPGTSSAPLLKAVIAITGDSVRLQEGMPATVNGIPLQNTISKPTVSAWPDGEYIVRPGQIWIFSSYSASSFDSRYFGPVELIQIRGKAIPVLTQGDAASMNGGNHD